MFNKRAFTTKPSRRGKRHQQLWIGTNFSLTPKMTLRWYNNLDIEHFLDSYWESYCTHTLQRCSNSGRHIDSMSKRGLV